VECSDTCQNLRGGGGERGGRGGRGESHELSSSLFPWGGGGRGGGGEGRGTLKAAPAY